MTAVFEINDASSAKNLEQSISQRLTPTRSDWEALTSQTAIKGTGTPTSGELAFDSDIYGQNSGKGSALQSRDDINLVNGVPVANGGGYSKAAGTAALPKGWYLD